MLQLAAYIAGKFPFIWTAVLLVAQVWEEGIKMFAPLSQEMFHEWSHKADKQQGRDRRDDSLFQHCAASTWPPVCP